MKNKTMKNLIAFFSFAVLILGAKSVSAGQLGFYYGGNSYNNSSYIDTSYYNPYSNSTTSYYQEPYTYVDSEPKVKYVYVPQTQTQTQVKYVPVETTKYVNTGSTVNSGATSNQAASVIGTTNNTTTKKIVTKATTNTGSNANTGQYISYDQNGQQMMLASAYNAYNAQGAQVVDGNGVTALTVAGSGGFMPSSVFQWFLVILLILAIIIVARMISKSFSKSHAPVSH